jgi:hypothetical protein
VLNVLRHINAVAKEKLIPKPPDTDSSGPRAKFREMAAKVFSVPKREVDEREKEWRKRKDATP